MAETDEKDSQGPPKAEGYVVHPQAVDLLVANIMPTTKYFESRFDFPQHQINELKEGQKNFGDSMNRRFEEVNKRFEQVDKRFEQVDKRLEQIVASIDRPGDKLNQRDLHQRSFTIRMFTIAITLSSWGSWAYS